MKSVHETLVEGLRRIDRYGWQPFAADTDSVGYCAGLALFGVGGDSLAALRVLKTVLELPPGGSATDLYRWNDTATLEEVRAVYLAAINATAPPPPDVELAEPAEALA